MCAASPPKPPPFKPPKAFWTLCLASTLFFGGHYFLVVFLPLCLTHAGFSQGWIGTYMAGFLLMAMCLRPWVGKRFDESDPRTLLLVGSLCFAVGCFGFLVGQPQWQQPPTTPWAAGLLWGIRALQALGFALFYSTSRSLATLLIAPQQRAQGISFLSNAEKMAMALTPYLAWQLGSHSHFEWGFTLVGLWALLGGAVLVWQYATLRVPAPVLENPAEPPTARKASFFCKEALVPGLAMAANAWVYGALIPFAPLLVAYKGIPKADTFHLVYALSLMGSRYLTGAWSDQWGRLTVILPGMALVLLALVGMVLAPTPWLFLLCAGLYGLGGGAIQPPLIAWAADRSPPERRGSAMATFTLLADLGQAMGQLAMGWLGQWRGFEWALSAIALGFAMALWALWRYHKGPATPVEASQA